MGNFVARLTDHGCVMGLLYGGLNDRPIKLVDSVLAKVIPLSYTGRPTWVGGHSSSRDRLDP